MPKAQDFMLREDPPRIVGKIISGFTQDKKESIIRPQQIGFGVYVGAGPKTLWQLFGSRSITNLMPEPPSKRNSKAISIAQRAEAKLLVIPLIPRPEVNFIQVISNSRYCIGTKSIPLFVILLTKQFLQLFQSITSARVTLDSFLKITHFRVKMKSGEVLKELQLSNHDWFAPSDMPGPIYLCPKLNEKTVSISLTKVEILYPLMIPSESKSYPFQTNQTLLEKAPNPKFRKSSSIIAIKQLLQPGSVKFAFYMSQPMTICRQAELATFFMKVYSQADVDEILVLQVRFRPNPGKALQLSLFPMGYCIFMLTTKPHLLVLNRKEFLMQAWKRLELAGEVLPGEVAIWLYCKDTP